MSNTRKANGDGSIFYSASRNRWMVKIQDGVKPNGTPRMVQFNCLTEAEAKRKLREFKKSRGATQRVDSTMTCEQLFNHWLYNVKRLSLKPTSFDRLEVTYKAHIQPALGAYKLSSVNASHLSQLINAYADSGKSFSSTKKIYDFLNAAFKFAVANRWMPHNPMDVVLMPSQEYFEKSDIEVLTDEEVAAVVTEAHKKYKTGNPVYAYGDAIILILNTGLRTGEITGLRLEDISLEQKSISVRRNLEIVKKRNAKDPTITEGVGLREQHSAKTYSGTRTLPLNDTALECVRRLLVNQKGHYLLHTAKGTPVLPATLRRMFYAIQDNCGVARHGLHALRHTFATKLFSNGVDVKTVSALLGHSSVKLTYDTYIHTIQSVQVAAINSLDRKAVDVIDSGQ